MPSRTVSCRNKSAASLPESSRGQISAFTSLEEAIAGLWPPMRPALLRVLKRVLAFLSRSSKCRTGSPVSAKRKARYLSEVVVCTTMSPMGQVGGGLGTLKQMTPLFPFDTL